MGSLRISSKEALSLFIAYCRNPRDYDLRKMAECDIHVLGSIRLGPEIFFLPPQVIFEGDVDARVCQLARFNCEVWGTANFAGSRVEYFGPQARFESDLVCTDTSKLKAFGAYVGGTANFRHSAVGEINSNAAFAGDLIACDTHQLKYFNAVVRGSADLSGSAIRKLGGDAAFGGELDMSHTPYLETFNHEVGWDAYFFQSAVKTFGPRTRIGGHLYAYGTWNLKYFEGSVAGDADFTGSSLSQIGSGAYFGGELDLSETPNIRHRPQTQDDAALETPAPTRGWTQSLQQIMEWISFRGSESAATRMALGTDKMNLQMRQRFVLAAQKAQHFNPITGRKR